jgi:hypothetical protein
MSFSWLCWLPRHSSDDSFIGTEGVVMRWTGKKIKKHIFRWLWWAGSSYPYPPFGSHIGAPSTASPSHVDVPREYSSC